MGKCRYHLFFGGPHSEEDERGFSYSHPVVCTHYGEYAGSINLKAETIKDNPDLKPVEDWGEVSKWWGPRSQPNIECPKCGCFIGFIDAYLFPHGGDPSFKGEVAPFELEEPDVGKANVHQKTLVPFMEKD